jgi:hypothetical protein
VGIREEVAASAGAHRDLGPGYDTAVAEGLVERIGEEIDRRVDARLFGHLQPPTPAPAPRPHRVREPGRVGAGAVFLALGSMGMGIGATVAVIHPNWPSPLSAGQGIIVALIWIVIAAINISYARRP